MSKERFACQTCPAFYDCSKPHMKATAGHLDFEDHGILWWLTPHGAPVPAFEGGKK